MREPLVWFLLAGAGLFAAFGSLHPGVPSDLPHRIELTPHDLRRISIAWRAPGRPPPSRQEMSHLVDTWVRDEILYREALALGLDDDDTIIKRRLVQKMEFLTQDLADLQAPASGELEAWFEHHAQTFAAPARVTFHHRYFSPDRRGGRAAAKAAAAAALARMGNAPADAPDAPAADGFMGHDRYVDRTSSDVAKDFGPQFAPALFGSLLGSWQGPIESGLGWHLVFVESLTPSRTPTFEEVAEEVRTTWTLEQRASAKRTAYERMRDRYEVVLPADLMAGLSSDSVPSAGPLDSVSPVARPSVELQ